MKNIDDYKCYRGATIFEDNFDVLVNTVPSSDDVLRMLKFLDLIYINIGNGAGIFTHKCLIGHNIDFVLCEWAKPDEPELYRFSSDLNGFIESYEGYEVFLDFLYFLYTNDKFNEYANEHTYCNLIYGYLTEVQTLDLDFYTHEHYIGYVDYCYKYSSDFVLFVQGIIQDIVEDMSFKKLLDK